MGTEEIISFKMYSISYWNFISTINRTEPHRKKKVQLHQRTIIQMQNSMNLIYTSFKRDLNSFDEQTIHKIFETEIIQIVHNLKHNV